MIRKLIEFNKHKHTHKKKKTKRNTVINEIVYEIKKNIEMIKKKNRENKKKKTEYQRGILDPRENLDNLVWIK